MTTGDTPAIVGSAYSATSYGLGDCATMDNTNWDGRFTHPNWHDQQANGLHRMTRVEPMLEKLVRQKEEDMSRRLVQVLIADPNENVPLEDSLLYKGEPKFTDATDMELYFEININEILKSHNEKRVKVVNKSAKDRIEYLEPAKIRDLKMVVVTIANFG